MYHINMHVHSMHSDGTQEPREIVRVAHYCGMKAVVLTEHEIISSMTAAREEAAVYGLEFMAGVEFSTFFQGSGCHILGYDFDPANKKLLSFIETLTAIRNDHTKRVFEYAVNHGRLRYSWDAVLGNSPGCQWFCNNQVFNAMLADGIYRVHDYDSFLTDYSAGNEEIGEPEWPDASEAIAIILEAGGVPVAAHPNPKNPQDERRILALQSLGLQGIEAVYPTHSAVDAVRYTKLAMDNKLYITGGTDLHGLYDEHFVSFQSHGATKEQFEALRHRVLS